MDEKKRKWKIMKGAKKKTRMDKKRCTENSEHNLQLHRSLLFVLVFFCFSFCLNSSFYSDFLMYSNLNIKHYAVKKRASKRERERKEIKSIFV